MNKKKQTGNKAIKIEQNESIFFIKSFGNRCAEAEKKKSVIKIHEQN